MSDKTSQNTLFRLLKYIKPHWYLILISTIAGVIKLFLPLVLPQTVKYFTDDVLISNMSAAEKTDEIMRCLLFLLVLYTFVYIPASYFRNMGAVKAGNRIMHKMRCEIFSHLQKMSASFHYNNKSGDLVTRINNDVDQVYNFIWNIATNLWIDSIMIVIYMCMMLKINVALTIISAIALPFSVIITRKLREKIKNYSRNLQSNISSISGYMQERMAGFATIKLFGLEAYENSKFNSHSDNIYKSSLKTNSLFVLGDSITNSSIEIISSVVVCFAASFIVKDQMSIGDLICFYLYLGYFITPIRRFSELTVNYARGIAGIERVFEILDTPVDIRQKENALKLGNIFNISFNNVFFRYST
ncbi:MAG: ABC transporter transmembrane domain-containing protein, partial [Lachnospiraceae bacterium]